MLDKKQGAIQTSVRLGLDRAIELFPFTSKLNSTDWHHWHDYSLGQCHGWHSTAQPSVRCSKGLKDLVRWKEPPRDWWKWLEHSIHGWIYPGGIHQSVLGHKIKIKQWMTNTVCGVDFYYCWVWMMFCECYENLTFEKRHIFIRVGHNITSQAFGLFGSCSLHLVSAPKSLRELLWHTLASITDYSIRYE